MNGLRQDCVAYENGNGILLDLKKEDLLVIASKLNTSSKYDVFTEYNDKNYLCKCLTISFSKFTISKGNGIIIW